MTNRLGSTVFTDFGPGGIVITAALSRTCSVKLIVCKDWRWMDISDLRNIFLIQVARVREYYVFAYRWSAPSKRRLAWDCVEILVNRVCLGVDEDASVSGLVTIIVDGSKLTVAMPNKEFLELHGAADLPGKLCKIIDGG